ncbi:MAG: GNAT family N-acetyltransferase, partial [Betaproteobacteria bacterium]
FGDFSGDWNWAAAFESLGVSYYPKLVSGIPYTPATGPRFLVRPGCDRAAVIGQLIATALESARAVGVSSWQCLFVEREDELEALRECGFLLRRGCQFHWHNRGYADFDDFLATFSAEKRKKVRRERRRVAEAGLDIMVRHGDEIDAALWATIHRHYLSTFERFGNHAAFSLAFFKQAGAALGRQMLVFIACEAGRPVASAICYRSGTTLYGRHWGAEADTHSLHFELCYYRGIDYCIREGLMRFEPGAQGEHKISRGFSPTPTWSAFWIADPGMRAMIGQYLRREQAAMAEYQDDLKTHEPYKTVAD